MDILAVGLGGALGAMARYGVHLALPRHATAAFPVATLLVNVLGCFLLGALMAWSGAPTGSRGRLLLSTGALGGFTTFSTLGFETFDLWAHEDRAGAAALSVALNVGLGLLAAGWGHHLVKSAA